MKYGKLIVFSGPSGVGKHTILQQITNKEKLNLAYSISMTTRQKREKEQHGVDYYFVSKEEFMNAAKNNELIEWAEFVGNYYGTPKQEVERLRKLGKNVVLEIEVIGALQVLDIYKKDQENLISIFLMPPSIEELKRRLITRNTEPIEVIEQRIKKASKEMEVKDKYKYQVINDDPHRAAMEVMEILLNEFNEQ